MLVLINLMPSKGKDHLVQILNDLPRIAWSSVFVPIVIVWNSIVVPYD